MVYIILFVFIIHSYIFSGFVGGGLFSVFAKKTMYVKDEGFFFFYFAVQETLRIRDIST